MLVRRTEPVPVECVARGYLSGSGWKEYQQTGSVCGVTLPAGLRESDRLPEPIFTPATKAESGHDINISEAEAARLVGAPARRPPEGADARNLPARRRARRVEGHHHRRHEVRVRPGRRRRSGDRRRAHRRSADARLVALLAERPSTSRATGSRASTSSSCATTWKRSAGTSSRRCRHCPTRSCAARARSTSRPTGSCRAANCSSPVRDKLETLVQEMLDAGVLLRGRAPGVREGLHHPGAAALQGQRRRRRRAARPAPQHRGPQDDGVPDQAEELGYRIQGSGIRVQELKWFSLNLVNLEP